MRHMPPATITKKPRTCLPDLALLLLYLGVRIRRLLLFPVFIDEAFHLRWARDVWSLHPLGGVPDGKALGPWVIALLYPFENGLWLARLSAILVGMVGLAALLSLGRRWLGARVSWAAGLLYVLLPYTFFFERLALADPLAASLGIIAAWLIALAARSPRRWYAVLAGLALAAAILAKLPMAVFLALPVAAWALVLAPGERRRAWLSIGAIYAVCLLLLAVVVGVSLPRVGVFGLGNAQRFTSVKAGTLPARVWGNARLFFEWVPVYVGWPILILSGVGVGVSLVRRERRAVYLAAAAALPTLEFWAVSTYPVPRYYLLSTGVALLLASYGAWQLLDLARCASPVGTWLEPVAGAAALIAISAPMVGFVLTAYSAPAALKLAEPDARDAIWHSTSGFGLAEGAAWLEQETGTAQGITVVCSAAVTCDRLEAYLYGTPGLEFARADVVSPEWVAAQDALGRSAMLAEDDPPHGRPFAPPAGCRVERLQQFVRPGGLSTFTLYQIACQSAG